MLSCPQTARNFLTWCSIWTAHFVFVLPLKLETGILFKLTWKLLISVIVFALQSPFYEWIAIATTFCIFHFVCFVFMFLLAYMPVTQTSNIYIFGTNDVSIKTWDFGIFHMHSTSNNLVPWNLQRFYVFTWLNHFLIQFMKKKLNKSTFQCETSSIGYIDRLCMVLNTVFWILGKEFTWTLKWIRFECDC